MQKNSRAPGCRRTQEPNNQKRERMQERLLSSPWDWKQVGAQVHSAAIPVQRPSLFAWCSEYPRIISKTNRVLSDATASLFQDFRMVRNGIPVTTRTHQKQFLERTGQIIHVGLRFCPRPFALVRGSPSLRYAKKMQISK